MGPDELSSKRISLGSWAFSFGPHAEDPIPFEQIARRLSTAGYDGIEICGFPPHVTLTSHPRGQARRELTRFLEDIGLGVSGYTADFTSVNPIAPGNRTRYLDLFERNLELCADIRSRILRVDTVAAPGSLDEREYRSGFVRLSELWHEAADIAESAGVLVCWEFEPGFVFNKPSEVLELHSRVAHRNFRLLFDTCHAWMCAVGGARQYGRREILPGGVLELLDLLDGRIGHVHVIDSDGTLYGDETSTHRPFGEGLINFHSLLPRLLRLPDIDWLCIDMCFCKKSWDLIESSRRYLLDLLSVRAARR